MENTPLASLPSEGSPLEPGLSQATPSCMQSGWGLCLAAQRAAVPGEGWGRAVGRTYIVQLVVEATGIADRVPIGVSAP